MSDAPDRYAEFRALRSFGSLDGFRCLSIVPVIYHHAGESGSRALLESRGFLGVDMFFVISGFLITTLLLREKERSGAISLRRFYARRALRILPLYYGIVLGLALVFATVARHGNTARVYFAELPFCLTYTTNWFPVTSFLAISWSLSAEEQFYFLWPPIEKRASRPLLALAILLVLSEAIALGAFDVILAPFGIRLPKTGMLRETTFTPILLGVLLAHLLHVPESFGRLARIVDSRFASTVFFGILVFELVALPADLRGWPRLVIQLTMAALLASAVIRPDHWLARFFDSKPAARIGALSYGMYLLHMPALHVVEAAVVRGLPTMLVFPATFALTYVLAELSYRFYETPFLRLKERFA